MSNEFLYKLIVNPAMDDNYKEIEYKFKTKHDMDIASESLADMLLFLQDVIAVMPEYSNCFIEQEFIDGDWVDIEMD